MRRARSELDEVACRLYELARLIGVTEHELLAFVKVLSKADCASVAFSPIEDVDFEFRAFSDGEVTLEITVRRDRTTIIKEYEVPELLVKGDISEVRLRPQPWPGPEGRRASKRRGRRRRSRGGSRVPR